MVNVNITGKEVLSIGGDEPESFILLIQAMSLLKNILAWLRGFK
jgi:hypothetical protein